MKKNHSFLAISLLTIGVLLLSSKIILAQPEAKKICFYSRYTASEDIKLSDLNPDEAVCLDDQETLLTFNSAKTSIIKMAITHGDGYIGTFTDKKNKVHLIRILEGDGIIRDDTSLKTYTIKDPEVRKKWNDIIDAAVRESRSKSKK